MTTGVLLTGTSAADSLVGGLFDDTLRGGAGDDTLAGGQGADILDGGTGIDFIDYSASSAAVQITLTGSSAPQVGGDAAGDVLTAIEGVMGSAYGDTLVGGGGNRAVTLRGGDGDDVFDMRSNIGAVEGGNGVDTLTWSIYTSETIDLAAGVARLANGQTLKISGVENVVASSSSDRIIGSAADNRLELGLGDDYGEGRAGNDTLLGGAGADTLAGGEGADLLSGGMGYDIADYSSSRAGVKVTVTGFTGAQSGGDAEGDVLSSIEGVIGSAFNDELVGGRFGAVTLSGGGGDDYLDMLNCLGTADGGAGFDTLRWSTSVAMTINLARAEATLSNGQKLTISGVEGVIGSSLADVIVGDGLANRIDLGSGDDVGSGGAGLDTLLGGNGNDTLDGGAGADSMAGGAGNDVYYVDDVGDVVTELANQGVDEVRTAIASYVLTENVERLVYVGSDDWSSTGNASANYISGGRGDDTLNGGLGNDTLLGGEGLDWLDFNGAATGVTVDLSKQGAAQNTGVGTDLLTGFENVAGGSGNDKLTGDAGDNAFKGRGGSNVIDGGAGGGDTLVLSGSMSDYSIVWSGATKTYVVKDLRASAPDGVDTLRNVEWVRFGEAFASDTYSLEYLTHSKRYDKVIHGPAPGSELTGGAGYDTFYGQGGDTIDGGAGDDTAVFGSLWNYEFSIYPGEIDLTDRTTGRTTYTSNVEHFQFDEGRFRISASDAFQYESTISLGGGLSGARPDVFLSGLVDYSASTAAVQIDLEARSSHGGYAEGDVLAAVSTIVGSAYGDVLTAPRSGAWLEGGAGNDTLTGAYVSGGDGDDVLNGDRAEGGAGNDTLVGSFLDGGDGDDRMIGGMTFIGGSGSDTAVLDTWDQNYVLYDENGNGGIEFFRHGRMYYDPYVSLGGIEYIELDGVTYAFGGEAGMHGFFLGGGSAGAQSDIFIMGKVDYSASTSAVQIDMDAGSIYGGYAEGDVLAAVSTIVGSAYGDVLTAPRSGAWLEGGAGNDTLTGAYVSGGDGDDVLNGDRAEGGAGDDTLVGSDLDGGAGDDRMVSNQGPGGIQSFTGGGGGADTAVFTNWNRNYIVYDENGGTDYFIHGTKYYAPYTSLDGIEYIELDGVTYAFGGEAGMHGFFLGGGSAGARSDIFIMGKVDYSASTSAVQIDMDAGSSHGGYAEGDVLAAVSTIVGSDYGDVLTAPRSGAWLEGGAGNDTLTGAYISGGDGDDVLNGDRAEGGAGDDTLVGSDLDGGAGDDRMVSNQGPGGIQSFTGGGGADTAVFTNWDRNYIVYDENGGTDYFIHGTKYYAPYTSLDGIEYIELDGVTYAFGGEAGMHGFFLGGGSAGARSDIFIMGDVDYSASTAAVTVDLAMAVGRGGYAEGDIWAAVTAVTGSAYADTLTDEAGSARLYGWGGNDTLTGGELHGGDGNDVLHAQSAGGWAILDGGAGKDHLYASAGVDTLTGGAGSDVFLFSQGTGADYVTDFGATGLEKDVIRFDPAMFANWTQVRAAAVQVGGDVVISAWSGDVVTLMGVNKAELTSSNFQFGF
ncbi:beta strand repeat-containing protein [Alsobacter sp. SYSU BS001988]